MNATSSQGRSIGDRIVRAGIVVGIAHLLFKIAGFVQSVVVGHYLDNETFDVIYAVAFEGCIFNLYLIGEEIIGPAFLPLFMKELDAGRREGAWRFANTVLTVQVMILVGVIGVLLWAPGWAIQLMTAWTPTDDPHKFGLAARAVAYLAPALLCFSIGSTTYMLLNAHKRFFLAAFGDASWKLCVLLAAAVGIGVLGFGFEAVLFGLVAGSVAKLGTHALGLGRLLRNLRPRLDLRSPMMRALVLLMLPLVLGIVFGKVRDVFNNVTVLSSLTEDGLMKANLFGRKIYVAIGWLVPYALSIAMFPFFCEMVDRDDRAQFADVLTRASRALLSVIVPLAMVCAVLAEPISMFLFLGGAFDPRTVGWIALSMACYTLVLPAYAVEYFLMQAFFAHRRMVAVIVVGIVFSAVSIAVSAVAIYGFGLQGPAALAAVALGFTLSRTLKAVALVVLLRRSIPLLPARETLSFLARAVLVGVVTALAAYVAAGLSAALVGWGWERSVLLVRLAAGGAAAALAFLLGIRLVHLGEPLMMWGWAMAKLRARRA